MLNSNNLDLKISIKSLFVELFKRLSSARRFQFKLLLALSFIVALLELFSLGALLPFLKILTSPNNYENNNLIAWVVKYFSITGKNVPLILFATFFGLFILFATIVRLLLLRLTAWLCHAIGSDISKDLYRKKLYESYSIHLSQNSSETIAAISSKVDLVINGEIIPLCNLITSAMILTIVLIAFLFYSPFVTIILISSFLLIYYVIMSYTKNLLSIASKQISIESGRAVRFLQEGLGGIRDVILGGLQESYVKIFSEADHKFRSSLAKILFISQYPRFVIEGLAMLVVITFALIMTINDDNSANLSLLPILGVFALAAQRLLPVTQSAYSAWIHINGNKDTLIDIVNLINLEDLFHIDRKLMPVINGDIEMINVCFAYSPSSPLVLSNVSFKIPKGAKVGIVGRTGSGKSTLVDILMGLLLPTSGKLMVNGQSINELNAAAWQAHLAHVPQSIFLADSTIEENIAFGTHKAKIDCLLVKHVAKIAQMAEVIDKWPEGYYTKVGERGIRLSGGQRQRLGIARALYQKADVLFFDEATSALDTETEKLIIDGIESIDLGAKSKSTIFMVAHRLSTLQNCTHILEIKNGSVTLKSN